MALRQRLGAVIGGPVLAAVVRFVCASQRKRVLGLRHAENAFASSGRAVIAFWHNCIFAVPYLYRWLFGHKKVTTLVSQSADGEVLARMLRRFGVVAVRGSTSEGATGALKGLVRRMEEGCDVCITPDGPRGPKYEVRPGTVALARLARVPIIPLAYACTRKIVLDSWDSFVIPLPFGRMALVFGEPIAPNGRLDDASLRDALARATEAAERAIAVGRGRLGQPNREPAARPIRGDEP